MKVTTVCTKGSGSTMKFIIALYVDDLLISGNSSEVIAKTKSSLSSMFKMKDWAQSKQFLGMRVKQSSYPYYCGCFTLYFFDMLEGLSDSTDASMYRSIIGKLIYAANCARPDLAVNHWLSLSIYAGPKSIHMEAAKHTLRYLKGTAELGLEYRAQKVYKLVGYSDTDYARTKQDRKVLYWLLSLCKIPVPLPVICLRQSRDVLHWLRISVSSSHQAY
ncbi:uncharacterized protein SAPINGB_P002468 [Magnusiomyces paraingens]|uniref:Reverse transcriptase Ty1/copia-type domain-containing protein n=1 Tax=Magnusiomyces paraingens TaxID=2606893 RepID=A0A5E8BJU5_9ASCO|nr:uncharacterized protein SAPINGB_P002468 [Saprochaete ingens]VVT49837.1 unnamed protein product [Saprochaete ingens]